MAYAADTTVPVERSQKQIRELLTKAKATQIGVLEDWAAKNAVVAFEMDSGDGKRRLMFKLPLDPGPKRTERQGDQFKRSRWRCLLLTIKAKLESVESGIEVFDEAFLAQIVMEDGRTVYERTKEPIALEYKGGGHVPLLGLGKK